MSGEANEDVKAMSFEQALEALEKIVDDLERGDVPLDQSIRSRSSTSSFGGRPAGPAPQPGV